MRIEQTIQFFRQNHEYMPFVSTFTSLYKIFDLAIHADRETACKAFHCTSLKENTLLRHIVLLNPIFGNLIIILYDFNKKNDLEFIQKALEVDALSLQYSSEAQENEQLVIQAFKKNIESFAFAHINIRNNKGFVSRLMEEDPAVFQLAGDLLRNNHAFILEMVKLYGAHILRYVLPEVLRDEVFMHELMRVDVQALKYSKI